MSPAGGGNRRIDRILEGTYLDGLGDLTIEELRAKRDECLAEREHLSLLRRLVQGRAEILKAELQTRGGAEQTGSLVERLSEILGGDEQGRSPSRGEALRVGLPEEEVLLARRRVERLVADAEISDPSALDDEKLTSAVDLLLKEERGVSDARNGVMRALDAVQDELKRRYKDDPTLALR